MSTCYSSRGLPTTLITSPTDRCWLPLKTRTQAKDERLAAQLSCVLTRLTCLACLSVVACARKTAAWPTQHAYGVRPSLHHAPRNGCPREDDTQLAGCQRDLRNRTSLEGTPKKDAGADAAARRHLHVVRHHSNSPIPWGLWRTTYEAGHLSHGLIPHPLRRIGLDGLTTLSGPSTHRLVDPSPHPLIGGLFLCTPCRLLCDGCPPPDDLR